MSGRIVVGYTATAPGNDAVALGSRLAMATGALLDLVLVLPDDGRSVITPPDAGYDRYLLDRAESWLADAEAAVPDAVGHRAHVRFGESFAEGLIAAAREFESTHIVIGAANGAGVGRHRLGTVAGELLHSSDIPVVLAPAGAGEIDPAAGVTRVTAAVGTRAGSDVLQHEAVALATAAQAPLRLVSLVTVDLPAGIDTGVIRIAGAAHADEVLTRSQASLPPDLPVEAVVAEGDSIEEAIQRLSWQPGEIAMVGSSRLAQPRRLFLGSTASKMLHELPVPLIVVPRTLADEGVSS